MLCSWLQYHKDGILCSSCGQGVFSALFMAWPPLPSTSPVVPRPSSLFPPYLFIFPSLSFWPHPHCCLVLHPILIPTLSFSTLLENSFPSFPDILNHFFKRTIFFILQSFPQIYSSLNLILTRGLVQKLDKVFHIFFHAKVLSSLLSPSYLFIISQAQVSFLFILSSFERCIHHHSLSTFPLFYLFIFSRSSQLSFLPLRVASHHWQGKPASTLLLSFYLFSLSSLPLRGAPTTTHITVNFFRPQSCFCHFLSGLIFCCQCVFISHNLETVAHCDVLLRCQFFQVKSQLPPLLDPLKFHFEWNRVASFKFRN